MEFSEKLKQLRTAAGMTQNKLAQKSGVSRRSIINYEAGLSKPRTGTLYKKLSTVLNVPVDYLKNDSLGDIDNVIASNKAKVSKEADKCISQIKCLFAGGRLSPDDRERVMQRIIEIYQDIQDEQGDTSN